MGNTLCVCEWMSPCMARVFMLLSSNINNFPLRRHKIRNSIRSRSQHNQILLRGPCASHVTLASIHEQAFTSDLCSWGTSSIRIFPFIDFSKLKVFNELSLSSWLIERAFFFLWPFWKLLRPEKYKKDPSTSSSSPGQACRLNSSKPPNRTHKRASHAYWAFKSFSFNENI